MSRKLSDDVTFRLTWLSIKELREILIKLNDPYKSELFNTLKYISNNYEDSDIINLLKPEPVDKPVSKQYILDDLKRCYIKDNDSNTVNIAVKGRKKSFKKTLKERVFEFLNNNDLRGYIDVLDGGIIDIAENTYKTLVSQWNKENGIISKRGRKSKGDK